MPGDGDRPGRRGRRDDWRHRRAQRGVRSWLRASADELRAALQWAAAEPNRRAEACKLAVGLAKLTSARGMSNESQRRYEQAADLAADDDTAGLLRLAAEVALSRLAGDDAFGCSGPPPTPAGELTTSTVPPST